MQGEKGGVCGKPGDWKRGSPRESAVLGMNRVRQCEFISVRRIPIEPTPGAGSQEQGSGLNKNVFKFWKGGDELQQFCILVSVPHFVHSHDKNRSQTMVT